MKITHRLVTPADAADWLGRYNTQNRNVMKTRVQTLTAAITRGEWRDSGDPIRFAGSLDDGSAVLLDGQHRLAAIVAARMSLMVLVLEAIEPDAQLVMDTGKSRSFANVLELRGFANSRGVAATARLGWQYDHGGLAMVDGGGLPPTHTQLLAWIEAHPGVPEAYRRALRLRDHGVPVAQAASAFAIMLLGAIDEDACELFFDAFESGAMLSDGDPILALRRHFLGSGAPRSRPRPGVQLAVIIKAWNAYRVGRRVHVLRFQPFGSNAERYPEPV